MGACFAWQSNGARRHPSDSSSVRAGGLHLVLPARSPPPAPATSVHVMPATPVPSWSSPSAAPLYKARSPSPGPGSSAPGAKDNAVHVPSATGRDAQQGTSGRRSGASTPSFFSEMSLEERETELADAYDRIVQLELENERLRQAMRGAAGINC